MELHVISDAHPSGDLDQGSRTKELPRRPALRAQVTKNGKTESHEFHE
jgi:hypothetical protein